MAVFWGVTLLMQAAGTFQASVSSYQAKRRNNPEDSHLHTHCRKNFKSDKFTSCFAWV
jgi:hypothetical protein